MKIGTYTLKTKEMAAPDRIAAVRALHGSNLDPHDVCVVADDI